MASQQNNKNFFEKLKDIDIFGRDIALYYKGKEQTKTFFGSIFTILLLFIYLTFFVFKLIRMLKKTDVTFYDSEIVPEERPFIQLNNDNFYGGFALEDPNTYDPFIDETIYTVKAFFKRAERSGGKWNWQVKEIELEQCKLEKFGKLYVNEFSKKPINKYYCFKEVNFKLEGTFNYDAYSMFYLQIFPCINSTENNNHCKSLEEIDYYLDGTFFSLQMEDIELTPEDFKQPTRPTGQDVYTTVGKKLFKEFHIYIKIVNVETDLACIGLDELKNKKVEKFLKYDYSNQMSNIISNDIYKTGECFADITIKLSNYVLTQKRTYVKLLDILGDVGGLMEIFLFAFKIISSFSTDLLFETSLVNSLFEFDLASNKILIQNNYKKDTIKEKLLDEKNAVPLEKFQASQKSLMSNSQNYTNYNLKDPSSQRKMYRQKKIKSLTTVGGEDLITRRRRGKKNIFSLKFYNDNTQKEKINENIYTIQKEKNKIPTINNEKREVFPSKIINNNFIDNNSKEINETFFSDKNKIDCKYKETKKINKIQLGKFWIYFCFVCAKKRKNAHSLLLNESMKIISENLDIINVFRKIYGKSQTEKPEVIQISENCIKELRTLSSLE